MRELLLLLSKYPWDNGNNDQLREFFLKVNDWANLLRLINDHGIIALASHNIREAGLQEVVPGDFMSALDNGSRQSLVRNIWLKEKWKEADSILSTAGIKHVLLKGMALENTTYGSAGLRQMSDIDVYIEEKDAWRAWEILMKNGFTKETEKSGLFRKIKPYPGKHLPELHREGCTFEIHINLPGLPAGSFENITSPIHIDNRKTYILRKDLHYSYLIDHFKRHLREGNIQLRQYTDLILLDPNCTMEFPENFILEPNQSSKRKYRKSQYTEVIKSIAPKYRALFIIGDMFPSIDWMKQRYECSVVGAVIRYPVRIFKLLRLL